LLPLASRNKFISESYYEVAERVLCIEARDEWSAQMITSFFGRHNFNPLSANRVEALDYTVRISCDKPPRVPPQLETFDIQRGLCHTDWQNYYLLIDESLILVHAPPSKITEVWIGESAHARHPVAIANLMSYAMQAAMRRVGLYELHAAGVVEPKTGVGTLFIGNSNCGKSTLTVRLVSEGWKYLSDDMLFLSGNNGRVEARGLRRIFSISPDIVEGWKLPRLKDALGGPIPSDPAKRQLDPRVMFPQGFVELSVPTVLIFPLITGDYRSHVEKLSQSSAMMKLMTNCAWARYDKTVASEYVEVLASLVRQSVSWALHAGRDIIEEPGYAATLLAQHVTE
jgi:hypothetical protein